MSIDLQAGDSTSRTGALAAAASVTDYDRAASKGRSRRRTVAVISALFLAATCVVMGIPAVKG